MIIVHGVDLSTQEEAERPNTGTIYVHSFTTNHAIPSFLEAHIIKAIEKAINDHYSPLPRPAATP